MIVRNEEANLPACLASVRGLFDEIVVVDTGSTDRTREIVARVRWRRVFDFVWVDDFAAARNAALRGRRAIMPSGSMPTTWSSRPSGRSSGRCSTGLRPGDEAAYVVRCACDPEPNGGGGQTVVDHIRLFPLREDVRWTYRGPRADPAGPAAGGCAGALDRRHGPAHRLHRPGPAGPEAPARCAGSSQDELADRPGDPFVLFNLGSIAIERQDWPGALEHLRRSLAGSAPTDSITRKLYALIARCHQMLGDLRTALAACAEGLAHRPRRRRAAVPQGRRCTARPGEPAEAEACWRRILTLRRPEQFCSVDQGIYGHLTRRNLAVLAEERGDRPRRRTSGARCWPSAPATPRPCGRSGGGPRGTNSAACGRGGLCGSDPAAWPDLRSPHLPLDPETCGRPECRSRETSTQPAPLRCPGEAERRRDERRWDMHCIALL